METWLQLKTFNETIVTAKMLDLHEAKLNAKVVCEWDKKDPRHINNTSRPSDYFLAGSLGQVAMLAVAFLDKYDRRQEIGDSDTICVWIHEIARSVVLGDD